MDGKNGENKTVSNPNIGYGLQAIKYADGKTRIKLVRVQTKLESLCTSLVSKTRHTWPDVLAGNIFVDLFLYAHIGIHIAALLTFVCNTPGCADTEPYGSLYNKQRGRARAASPADHGHRIHTRECFSRRSRAALEGIRKAGESHVCLAAVRQQHDRIVPIDEYAHLPLLGLSNFRAKEFLVWP